MNLRQRLNHHHTGNKKLQTSESLYDVKGEFYTQMKSGGEYAPNPTTQKHQERSNLTNFHSERSNSEQVLKPNELAGGMV